MIKKLIFIPLLLVTAFCFAQTTNNKEVARPKLVVGIVIDQMRWDYIYKFYPLYSNTGGFKRFLNQGFTCDNTLIPYTPTVTAAGHTCVFTGSVPAIHGIVGNEWFNKEENRVEYCAEDDSVTTVGANDDAGKMSPKNCFATTVGDELRIATNFASKVIGISVKDRASIFPAGHAANAAYWYDGAVGKFITSNYYMNELPSWLNNFNDRDITDSLYKYNWTLSLPESVYHEYAGEDVEPWENQPFGVNQTHFPYQLNSFIKKDYGKLISTPYGNNLLELLAESVISNEAMGKHNATDMLTVSFSTPDYIGHAFGPNSWEQLDDYIKLDSTLGRLFSFLDAQVGKGNYTVFLTADHGVAQSPGFSVAHKLPGGAFSDATLIKSLNQNLKTKYNTDNLVQGIYEFQLVLNDKIIDSAKLDKQQIIQTAINFIQQQPEVAQAISTAEINSAPITSKQKEMFQNGFYAQRDGDIQIILKPGYVDGNGKGTSHGLWNPYDSHIPLLWYGWGIKQGKTNRETYMTDIAATVSALLHIQMPSGCVGKVIEEVMK